MTTLKSTGSGSLREALRAKGPRIIVFEVGGVIDLDGNVFEYGPDTSSKSPLFRNYGGGVDLFLLDNLARTRAGDTPPLTDREPVTIFNGRPSWIVGPEPLPAGKVKVSIERNVGARPWDRDPIDARIIRDALSGTGRIIDSENEVGGYPHPEPSQAAFRPEQWDLRTMQRR